MTAFCGARSRCKCGMAYWDGKWDEHQETGSSLLVCLSDPGCMFLT